jgi:hypothetical protein
MKCNRCGHSNQDDARFCNNCGADQQSKGGAWKVVLALVVGLCVLSGIVNRFTSTDQTPSSGEGKKYVPSSPPPPVPAPALAPAPAAPETAWQYGESEDAMTGQKTRTAVVTSSNTVEFAFPYAGEQHATLILRKKRGSDNIMLSIEKGQLTCGDYYGRSVSVRFDEKTPRRFSVLESADHDSTVVFIRNEKSFIAEAKKAKKIRIEAVVYQNGNPVFEFNTAGLEW